MDLFIVRTARTNLTLGQIATFAERRAQCPVQVFLVTAQKSVMGFQPVRIIGTNCSPLAMSIKLAAARRTDSLNAQMAPAVLLSRGFVTVKRIVQMERMKTLSSAEISVSHSALFVSSLVTTAAVFGGSQPAALSISPCARMAVTWQRPFAKISVTLNSVLRIHTVCRVSMASRSASSAHQNATANQTVTTLGLI